jgi:L-cysteine/cystine lyase
VDASALRAEFPVLEDRAYLNAGTCGPLPHATVRRRSTCSTAAPRWGAPKEYVETLLELRDRQRAPTRACSGRESPTSR